jgi:dihydroneopterin aldolase
MKTEIHLQGMEFHAFHGVYPEEKKLGNRFRVDVLMKLDVAFQPENEDLSRTVDYSVVYSILKSKMENATPLLESLGQGICRELAATFPIINEMEVSIAKANPAIGGLCEWVKVRSIWTKEV